MMRLLGVCATWSLLAGFVNGWAEMPHPESNPESPVMLKGDWFEDPHEIDFGRLPRLPAEHAVISDVRAERGVNQHVYLTYYAGQYWAMWSDGPRVEDRVGQQVKYAVSPDGLKWSEPKSLSGYPPNSGPESPLYGQVGLPVVQAYAEGHRHVYRYIARGFWERDADELLALVSLDEARGYFGPELELRAFRWLPEPAQWEYAGRVYDNAINNFPPKKLPSGEWMMSRRPYNYSTPSGTIYFLIGGITSFDDWRSYPVPQGDLGSEEPMWWTLPDNNQMALFRDNHRSGFLFRSFSIDNGRTWSNPIRTDFPDARSKFHGVRLSDGRYVLVSNPHPRRRDPLTLAISDDGMVFTKMWYLVGGRHVDYPFVMEHDDYLFVAFTGGKHSIELYRIRMADLDGMATKGSRL